MGRVIRNSDFFYPNPTQIREMFRKPVLTPFLDLVQITRPIAPLSVNEKPDQTIGSNTQNRVPINVARTHKNLFRHINLSLDA